MTPATAMRATCARCDAADSARILAIRIDERLRDLETVVAHQGREHLPLSGMAARDVEALRVLVTELLQVSP